MRLLIIAEGATLAHVGRPLLVAEEAVRRGWHVVFARPRSYAWMTRNAAFDVVDLDAQSPEVFARRLASGSPLYDLATLDAYVDADRTLVRTHRPDAVIGDFRLSLAVSARLEGCRYATLSNAYWSPYCVMDGRWPVPDIPMTRFMPIGLAEVLFNLVRPLAFGLHASPMRQLRAKYGLSPSGVDLQTAYTDADLVCYCDFPGLFELKDAPSTHIVVGPLVWSPDVPVPEHWMQLRDDRPVVYFTLGSSGRADLAVSAARALAEQGHQVIMSSAGRPISPGGLHGVFLSDMLPGEAACARASVVVCNGGSPTTQQALLAGRPVVAVPTNLDQFLNMSALQKHGLGRVVRSDRFSPERLCAAVAEMSAAAGDSASRFHASHAVRSAAAVIAGQLEHS